MPGRPSKRSLCPVACTLDLIGDKWTLLILRDAFFGAHRYRDFTGSPEGIPTNILADRLEKLVAAEMLERRPLAEGGAREGYFLTDKGRSLLPVLRAMKEWGLQNIPGTRVPKTDK